MTTTKKLDSTPGMMGLFARAAAGTVPGAGLLPFVGGRGSQLPDLELVVEDIEIDPSHLATYNKVCGFTLRDTLSPTYPHMLAFPLHLALMTDPGFPYAAVGMVQIGNRIIQHRPIRTSETLSLKAGFGPLEEHPKGRQFTILVEARSGDELVWESVSRELRRGAKGDAQKPAEPEVTVPEDLPTVAEWRLEGDLGRRYGSASGDQNPIHLYDWTAKPFGFSRAIIHGMWTKARCLAALESRLGDSFTADVRFRAPIMLPAKVEFASAEDGGEIAFEVRDARKGTPHLAGRLS